MVVTVSAQELDEAFLESSPDDIRQDLSEKNASKSRILKKTIDLTCIHQN